MTLHLIKLCVGVESVEDLARRELEHYKQGERICHITRMMPTRAEELLDGGSLYWVMKRKIRVRQKLLAIERFRDSKGISRARIVLEPELIQVVPRSRRPFQGWRYFQQKDTPQDKQTPSARISLAKAAGLKPRRNKRGLPESLEDSLEDMGVL